MLGRLSPHALAAGALGFFLYQPLFLFGLGVVGALSPIAAARIGAGQGNDGLRRATHQALIFAVAFAAVVWIALIGDHAVSARDRRTGGRGPRRRRLLKGFQWGLAPSLMYYAARAAFSALERPRPALIAGLLAVAFNALANYALDLRQARHAGARDYRIRPRDDTVADADVRPPARLLAGRPARAVGCGSSPCPGASPERSLPRCGGLACRSAR